MSQNLGLDITQSDSACQGHHGIVRIRLLVYKHLQTNYNLWMGLAHKVRFPNTNLLQIKTNPYVRVAALGLIIYYLSLQPNVTFRTWSDRVKSLVHMIRQDTGKRVV